MLSKSRRAPLPGFETSPAAQLCIALIAGSIIALQIALMRVFAVGSWAHFGSLVISLAMLAFSLSSVIIFVFKEWIERHWLGMASLALWSMGPLVVMANLTAQRFTFNAIFIVSDPEQKWRLLFNFLLYLLPFLSGAIFLGIVFLKARARFSRMYFADLAGSGAAGLVMLGALYVLPPETILSAALLLWGCGATAWFIGKRAVATAAATAVIAGISIAAYVLLPGLLGVHAISVTQYKGISYARNFPDATRVYRNVSPFGDLQVYKSAYMHFAPGLSDNAAFNMPEIPADTFLGLYVDGEGPEGIMRELPPEDAAYYQYLPAHYPYVIKNHPKTFVVQLGGGISTMVALHANSSSVTAAESNPAIIAALRDPSLKDYTHGLLDNTALNIVAGDGRLYLAHSNERYDVIDLSLAGSIGLSNPGGFAIVERYAHTKEAMLDYINSLADGGILSITVWNKEEPLKSALKFYATIAAAARAADPDHAAQSLFVASSYLSTTTVLYKKSGFNSTDIDKLRAYTRSMSFDEIYSPGFSPMIPDADTLMKDYRNSIFGSGASAGSSAAPNADASDAAAGDAPPPDDAVDVPTPLPATSLARLAWSSLINGNWKQFHRDYVFDVTALTDDRPYFAGYEKFADLPRTIDRLDLFQDDWGYLVLWATLGVATLAALSLIVLPLLLRRRSMLSRSPGAIGCIVFFACLGLAFIMVEVGLIGRFTLVLANPTISASVLISCLLVFSGLGSLCSARIVDKAQYVIPAILAAIVVLLLGYSMGLASILAWIGGFPYGSRLAISFALVAPSAFLMGFPMATAMVWLARLGKDHLFVWAWGINGCFSVIGAAMVPIIATSFGLSAVLNISACAYVIAMPAFFSIMKKSAGTVGNCDVGGGHCQR